MPSTKTNTNTATMEQQNTSHFKLSATSCGTCAVHFDTPETRRAHSKSQWHVTNLKRRIADLEPLTAEQHAATVPAAAGPAAKSAPEDSSTSASDADTDGEAPPEKEFVPEECLFCNAGSGSLDDNVAHMHKAHGMFVPDRERLAVDVETLLRYLHLVVQGYRECLQCGTQRRTAEAVQQHMVGKNHCRFDITAADSEFRDFYEKAGEDGEADAAGEGRGGIADVPDENGAVRLPSGKMVSHRSAPAPSRPRAKAGTTADGPADDNLLAEDGPEVDESKASFQLTAPSSKRDVDMKALSRAEKRDVVFETQLARLSVHDRTALAHLPAAEQRSVLATRQKQLEKAERAARRLQTRLEMKSNRTGQGHFVNDVPGRKNG